MRVTVSPYDVTHRSSAVVSALLIADSAATIVPIARAWGEGDPEAAVEESPALGRVLDAWRWAGPVWRAGILGPTDAAGVSGVDLIVRAMEELSDARAHPLMARVTAKARTGDRDRIAEDACIDIARGGRNPGISVPVGVAAERFAVESGWPIVVGPTGSVVGGIEQSLATPIAGLDCPSPRGVDGEDLMRIRERLAPELERVRAALGEVVGAAGAGAPLGEISEMERSALGPAGEAVCAGAAELVGGRTRGRSADWSMVRVTVARLPADAMVRAAEIAAGQMVGARGEPSRGSGGRESGGMERAGALALVVRPLPWDLTPSV